MSISLGELLKAVRSDHEREEIKASIIAMMDMTDDDIDFSDIPQVTDFSTWIPAEDYLKRIAEHNRKLD
mgnify:CR=1 FL=1